MKKKMSIAADSLTSVWQQLRNTYALTAEKARQFERYLLLLTAWNRRHNITRITNEAAIVTDHFYDSLALTRFVDVTKLKGVADVGSGGGFPGLPLAIMYPNVPIILIEVSQKKIAFLREVVKELGLKNVHVADCDWRTFLRQAVYPIDLICARASLKPDELVRMFKPGCAYRDARLVYWASKKWEPSEQVKKFLVKKERYVVGAKERFLVFFEAKKGE